MTPTYRPNADGIFPKVPRDLPINVALGNGTLYRVLLNSGPSGLFVAIETVGAYTFTHAPHPGYVCDKFRMNPKFEADYNNLADFIGDQFDGAAVERWGSYHDSLTKPHDRQPLDAKSKSAQVIQDLTERLNTALETIETLRAANLEAKT